MKKIISFLFCTALFCASVAAQNAVVVFCKNGDILRFPFLTSIECSTADASGNDTGKVINQIFSSSDGSISIIPVADIDSVAFGPSDNIIPKAGVRRIVESELPYIIKFSGSELVYRPDTPAEVIPPQGVKLYYDAFADLLPYGLCAEVVGISRNFEGIILRLRELNPSDVFDKYFISGDFEVSVRAPQNVRQRAELQVGFPVELESDIVNFKSNASVAVRYDNLVASVLTGYYSADIKLGFKSEMDLAVHTSDPVIKNLESSRATVLSGVVAGVICPRLDVLAFMDLAASATLGLNLERENSIQLHWVHKDGKDTFTPVDNASAGDRDGKNDFTIDFQMDGSMHFGIMADLSFNTLFNVAGAGFSAKFGPEFKSSFGAGTVRDLSKNFSTDAFAKAVVEISLLTKLETYAYSIFSAGTKAKLPFEMEYRTLQRSFRLLPDFSTRAVRCQTQPAPGTPSTVEPAVSVASVTQTPVARELPVGFSVENRESGSVITQEFNEKPLAAGSSESQGFSNRLSTSENDISQLIARPVVKYAESVLKLAPVDIVDNACIQPIFSAMSGQGAYMVAGAQIIGQEHNEIDTYIVGNHMPVVAVNPAFTDDSKRTFKTLHFINADGTRLSGGDSEATLFGTWKGSVGELSVTLVLNSDMSVSYNGESAVAAFNTPQIGEILLDFGKNRRLIIEIIDVTADTLTISFKNSTEQYILKK